ncbi:hypothetical protein SLA2020_044840 [Shorea laevis]
MLECGTCFGCQRQLLATQVLKLERSRLVVADIFEWPIPSLLWSYGAPIHLESDLSDSDLFFLLTHDSDEFNRIVLLKSINTSIPGVEPCM